jgi:BirA family biotin operon repressor/biotin-[acetyl-CoA-carboxylase] ligase
MNVRAEWQLDTCRLGRRVLLFDSLDSTNTQAAALGHDPANDGIIIAADHQSAGRGQHGRTWQCQPQTGLLVSVLLFPPPTLRRPAVLTAWAAVSVCETIRRATDLPAKIKWPNDVLVRGKKVCGILIEQGRGTVAGIGLNVNQSAADLARAGLPLAGSLAGFTSRPLDRDDLLRLLVHQLDEEYDRLCQGDVAGLEACWKWRIGLLGKQVAAECLDGTHRGRLRELAFDGIALEHPSGRTVRLAPESVQHLEPA